MPISNPSQRQAWIDHLAHWRLSGLNGAAWCRERGIAYPVFLYWKRKLESKLASEGQFVEITNPEETNLILECNGITIRLSTKFDTELLKNCLLLLKRLPC